MKRQLLTYGLITGAALILLGGCASYDDDYYGRGYSSGGAYYGGSYYDPDYYGSQYYGSRYYGRTYVPYGGYGGYGGGHYRDRHDGDRTRDHDGDRGDRRGYNSGDTNRDVSRNQPQQNTQPSQPSGGGGWSSVHVSGADAATVDPLLAAGGGGAPAGRAR